MIKPAPRQPSTWIRVLAAAGAATIIGASIVLSTTPVAAAGLETFASCDDLQAQLDVAATDVRYGAGADMATGGPTPAPSLPTTGANEGAAADGAGGGTNTQVEGIDELDIVEVLGDGRILAARDDRILLIDAKAEQILATLPVAGPPQITFDEERATLWAVSSDGLSTTLTRSSVDGSAFGATSTWAVDGRLVDLRRRGDQVHLVAVDDQVQPMMGDVAIGADVPRDTPLPFGGTSPVPCDKVLHSPLPGGPATTLVATFAATGELTPLAATEIVGAGDNVLVTDTALYVSTPTYDVDQLVTGIHRFDLDGLALTGSGSVQGRLLNQFSLDEHAGHLRAAVTVDGAMFVGQPMPIEDGIGTSSGDAVSGDVGGGDVGGAPVPMPTEVTAPAPTEITAPAPTEVTEPAPVEALVLNEIVIFDLDGTLDVVGRSARFGHPGETLQGIRFAGDIGYAVTYLQTDPLYVIDLSEPAFPRVLGQIEIPGFSAYLHPIRATQVIGFGPDDEGHVVARLFDTSDPAAPQLVDTAIVAADSPIVYDHHALRADGDRLVVAANAYVSVRPAGCGPVAGQEQELNDLYRQMEALYQEQAGTVPPIDGVTPPDAVPPDAVPPPDAVTPAIAELQARIDALTPCVYPSTSPQARIILLAPDGNSLQAQTIETDASDAQRVVPVQGGYLIVGSELTSVGADGVTRVVLDQAGAVDQPVKVNESTSASNAGA